MAVSNNMLGNPATDPYYKQKYDMLMENNSKNFSSVETPLKNFNISLSSGNTVLDWLNPIGAVVNTISNVGSSLANFKLQKENLAYQKALQSQIFEREDTAIQRRVNDLKSAGLSPVLASGSGASAGAVVSTSAPQVNMRSPFDHLTFFDGTKYALGLLKTGQDMALAQERLDILREQLGLNRDKVGLQADDLRLKKMKFNRDVINDIGSAVFKLVKFFI